MKFPRTDSRFALWFAVAIFLLPAWASLLAANYSTWIFPGPSGRLIHQPDALGNRIVDASGVGYKSNRVPLPNSNSVPVKVVVSPVAGDNTANIQSAINQVQAMPLDTNGFRGAVLLSAGEYPCAGTIKITASGVVLRGVGSFTNGSGTVLRATATNQYSLVQITGSGSASVSTTHQITNQYVPVGARSFNVDSTSGLVVGDRVYVRRYATSKWIHDIGMDLLTNPWTPDGYTINMDRIITRVEGNRVFVDDPVTCAIDRFYTNGALLKFTWTGRITNSGIEHIYGKSDYFGSNTNETHGWIFVQFNNIEDGWARDLVSQYFGYSCVALYSGTRHVTVADCKCLDPISIITGGRRYGFVMDDDQLCLVKNCYTRQDRHQFVTQSLTIGPNVFVDGLSDNAHAEAGPHHRWATAAIWDNITVNGHDLDAQNTCESGSGHGWEGANCAIWNSKANNLKVASPPTALNWLIGSIGTVSKGGDCHGVVSQPGAWDSSGPGGPRVFPDSLYFTDLQNRLAEPKLQTREYWLGIIDGFTNTITRDAVPVDSAWSNAVQSIAGAQPLVPFNVVSNGDWVPFTFNFTIGSNEHLVAATLSLAMRASNSANGDVLYLGSTSNRQTFSSLGWLPVGTGTNTTVRVLDLSNQLNLLTNGQCNVAVQGDAGIDWAMLELQVAPTAATFTTMLNPVADATVRAGTSAGNNYGAAATLTVRQDSSANNIQQVYLRWDLSGVASNIYQARVVLTPSSVGANNIEQGVAPANSNNWSESGITWNNQPGRGERFASWLVSTNGTVSFDVTAQALDAMAGDKQLSLQLFSISTNSVDYASRENPNVSSRPQLVIAQPGAAPTISDIADRTIAANTSTGPIPFTINGAVVSSLTLSGDSSNPALVPDSNIVFGGSGTNRTVTVTPLANQSGIASITVTVSDPTGISASDSFILTVSSHGAATIVWNGPGAGLNDWSTSGYWLPAETPEFLDAVKFFDPGSVAGIGAGDDFVDLNFGGNIASLQYGNTNGNHTTMLAVGAVLNILGNNGLIVGTETDNGTAQTVFATIAGGNGILNLGNTSANLIVRQGTANSGGSQRATLDLSGLGEFDALLNQILAGVGGPVNRATATLYLGRTNDIVATGSPGILVGDNGSNGGGQNFIWLGQTNSIFADSIVIGRRKATATLKFNPAFSSPSAFFRAVDGTSRINTWSLGDGAILNASSSSSIGTNDFSGGSVDALVDVLTVGRSQQTSGANGIGALTFTGGTFDVNTLQIGFQTQAGVSAGIGAVNVNGTNALLNVNSLIALGFCGSGTSTNITRGALNINGGQVSAEAIAVGSGSGTNSLSMNNARLVLATTAGSLALPIHTVSLTNSTVQFAVASGVTNCVANELVTGAGSNVINIGSLPNISFVPIQFPLLKYSGAIGGAGYNFVLGTLPTGLLLNAYLSNNAANESVDLVITNFATPEPFLTWNGNISGDWDTETGNWKNNTVPGQTYADGDDVVFNDAGSGTTIVNLTDMLTPNTITVSNSSKEYVFTDSGNLSGSMALLKQGNGTLVIANGGSNDFTGGMTITAGTLTAGDGGVNGNLPATGNITNNGTLAFNRSNDVCMPNVISGLGSLVQTGSGILTLSASNTFTGATLVSNGTLLVNGALGNSPVTVLDGARLGGNGTLGGTVTVNSGATLAPGANGLGILAISGPVTLRGTTRMELNRAFGTSDLLLVGSTLSYGGTLSLTNLSGVLAPDDSFRLFSALGYSGAFTNFVPATPGPGLMWDTSLLTANGMLKVSVAPRPVLSFIALAGTNLALTAANGVPGEEFYVLQSTNVSLPVTNWTPVLTNAFGLDGQVNLTIPVNAAATRAFYLLELH